MAASLEAQLILCDAAESDPMTGKIHMLGAGWSTIGTPAHHAVAVLIKVPRDRVNQRLSLELELRNADGSLVELTTQAGRSAVRSVGDIEVGPSQGAVSETLDASFALNVAPLPLEPGHYEWHLKLAELELSTSFLVQG